MSATPEQMAYMQRRLEDGRRVISAHDEVLRHSANAREALKHSEELPEVMAQAIVDAHRAEDEARRLHREGLLEAKP